MLTEHPNDSISERSIDPFLKYLYPDPLKCAYAYPILMNQD